MTRASTRTSSILFELPKLTKVGGTKIVKTYIVYNLVDCGQILKLVSRPNFVGIVDFRWFNIVWHIMPNGVVSVSV